MSDDDETVTEIVAARIPRVDAVDQPAHGMPFLILKAADLDPLAAAERVWKAKYTVGDLRCMGKDGRAYRTPSGDVLFPTRDVDDLTAAVGVVQAMGAHADDAALGLAGSVRKYLHRRARQLGAADRIPADWAPDGTIIAKADSMGSIGEALDDLHPDGGVIEPGDVVPDAAGVVAPTHEGDPDDPTSPAWEAVDAAQARAAVEKVTWLQGLVRDMLTREGIEATATGDLADAQATIDLNDVLSALDCALTLLARHAVTEQAEADDRAEEIREQAEALGITKALDAITKAGRVLSTANEQALRRAADAINEVLGRLPAAPATSEEAPVGTVEKAAGETPQPDTTTTDVPVAEDVQKSDSTAPDPAPVEPVEKAAEPTAEDDIEAVAKAAGMDVETLRGMLMKLVRALPDSEVQAAFQSMAGAVSPVDAGEGEEDTGAEPVEEPPAEPAPAAEPEPTGEVEPVEDGLGVPVLKAESPMTVNALVGAFKAAVTPLEERVEAVAKSATDAGTRFQEALDAALAPLVERIEKMESTPVPGPMLNGQVPGGDPVALRGQGTVTGDPIDQIRKMIDGIDDPAKKTTASTMAVYEVLKAMNQHPQPVA